MKALDLLVAFVAGAALGLLLASLLDEVERRELRKGADAWPSL
jgi:uncharacterized protein involved in exopolysaccharide biosynthesis